jgi:hypothetical protein
MSSERKSINAIPVPNLSWGLTEKEARRQKNKVRQAARRKERRKEVMREKTALYIEKWKKSSSKFESHGAKEMRKKGYDWLADKWQSICTSQSKDEGYERVFQYGENIILLFLALKDARSLTQVASILAMYVKMHLKEESLVKKMLDYIMDIFKPDGTEGEQSLWQSESGEEGWMSYIFSGWKLLRAGPLFSKVSALLSTLLAMGLMSDTKELKYSSWGMDLFRVSASKGHKTAVDLIEAILGTMKFFVERGYKCFETGSISPLFFDDDAPLQFYKDYTDFTSKFECVRLGNYDQSPWKDDNHFDLELKKITERCELIMKDASKHDRTLVARHLETLKKLRTSFELTRQSGGLRMAPYAFLIYGNSDVGKSTIANNLIVFALRQYARIEGREDEEIDANCICTLNELDQYDSDYKSHTQAVLLDDMANARMDTTGISIAPKVINFINNIPRTAVMADVESKGKIQIRPKVVCGTTNNWADWAYDASVEPLSLLRRFRLHITARVRKDYLVGETAIDGAKLKRDAEKGIYAPDAWEFDVDQARGVTQGAPGAKGVAQRVVYSPVLFKDFKGEVKEAKGIRLGELFLLVKQDMEKFISIQKSVAYSSKQIFKQGLCPCGMHPLYCSVCKNVFEEELDKTFAEAEKRFDERSEEIESHSGFESQSGYVLEQGCDPEPDIFFSWEHWMGKYPLNYFWCAIGFYLAATGKKLRPVYKIPPFWMILLLMCMVQGRLWYLPYYFWVLYLGPAYQAHNHMCFWQSVIPRVRYFYTKIKRDIEIAGTQRAFAELNYTIQQTILPPDMNPVIWESQSGVKETFDELYDEYLRGEGAWKWENWIPDASLKDLKIQYTMTYLKTRKWVKPFLQYSLLFVVASLVLYPLHFTSILGTYIVGTAAAIRQRKEYVIAQLMKSRELLPKICKTVREGIAEHGKKLFFFATALLAIYALYKSMSSLQMMSQGNDVSVHMEETNVWLAPKVEELPKAAKKDVSADQLFSASSKQQVWIKSDGHFYDGLFVDSGLLVIPGHEVPKKTVTMSIRRDGPGTMSGLNFDCKIAPEDCVSIDGADAVLVYCPRAGDRKDLFSFFPDKVTKSKVLTRMFYRNEDGTLMQDKTRVVRYGHVKTDQAEFDGPFVQYTKETFKGMCMASHIYESDSRSYFVGFHAAGQKSNMKIGALTCITSGALRRAREQLESRPTVLIPKSMGNMQTEQYDIDFTPREEIEAKSPTRFQEEGHISHFGTMPRGKVRPRSAVIISPASETVEAVTGVARQHGKPANCRKFGDDGESVPAWDPYQKFLSKAGNAYQEFDAETLEWAMLDYCKNIDDICKSPSGKQLLDKVRILSEVETVSGVDGMRFVDKMKAGTSMGWPLNKPKRDFMIELEVDDEKNVGGNTCPMTMDDDTLAIAKHARLRWLEGTRSYDCFKSCTKDEPTSLTKTKVRVFQAGPVPLGFNVRMYFLTMCHFLSMASLKSECAVGINSQGRGWHELNEFMIKFGEDRIVAGDFSAYDQHMSARMTLCAFKVFEHIAKKAGYSDEDICIMRGCATEICFPVMSLDGELIQLYGSNPSGQPLTVYLNSIVNSLYHRCVFKKIYPGFQGRFSDVVALMTYGDDCKMSVHRDYPLFNHTNIQAKFAEYGIKYTMAEKEADSVPYINHMDADFLKRKSRWQNDWCYRKSDGKLQKGLWLAMLDEKSIFKSLHCNLKSKEQSPTEVAVQCIEGAMREWWFYGEEVFNNRHEQMKEVVKRLGWENFMSPGFDDTYHQRRERWFEENEVFYADDEIVEVQESE